MSRRRISPLSFIFRTLRHLTTYGRFSVNTLAVLGIAVFVDIIPLTLLLVYLSVVICGTYVTIANTSHLGRTRGRMVSRDYVNFFQGSILALIVYFTIRLASLDDESTRPLSFALVIWWVSLVAILLRSRIARNKRYTINSFFPLRILGIMSMISAFLLLGLTNVTPLSESTFSAWNGPITSVLRASVRDMMIMEMSGIPDIDHKNTTLSDAPVYDTLVSTDIPLSPAFPITIGRTLDTSIWQVRRAEEYERSEMPDSSGSVVRASPPAARYHTPQSIRLFSISGAWTAFTVDGTEPSCDTSDYRRLSVSVSSDYLIVRAIGCIDGERVSGSESTFTYNRYGTPPYIDIR